MIPINSKYEIEQLLAAGKIVGEVLEFMKEKNMNGVRLQLQLHKYIWDPQKRGV